MNPDLLNDLLEAVADQMLGILIPAIVLAAAIYTLLRWHGTYGLTRKWKSQTAQKPQENSLRFTRVFR